MQFSNPQKIKIPLGKFNAFNLTSDFFKNLGKLYPCNKWYTIPYILQIIYHSIDTNNTIPYCRQNNILNNAISATD